MSWKSKVKNWDGKLYKVLRSNRSFQGGDFKWSLPEGDNLGNWTPVIEDVRMYKKGYHLTTHYAHWSNEDDVSIYEAEGDVIGFDGYDVVVCTKARLLRLVENPFSKNNFGYNNFGDCNSGNMNFGWCNSGNRNSGYLNSGNENPGDRNSGNYNLGSCNSGNHNSGNRNSGNHNSGNYNSGNWNSGNRNCGYFCRDSSPIIIFEKLAPENWKPKFPDWMYFELLSEGYKISWQKAFEKADIEGIKELLTLPNFDYNIFEYITSITRKQIERKLDLNF